MVAVEEKDAEANKKTTFQVNTGATEQGNSKNNSPTSVGQIHVWEMDLKESSCSTTSSITITPSRKSESFKQETDSCMENGSEGIFMQHNFINDNHSTQKECITQTGNIRKDYGNHLQTR